MTTSQLRQCQSLNCQRMNRSFSGSRSFSSNRSNSGCWSLLEFRYDYTLPFSFSFAIECTIWFKRFHNWSTLLICSNFFPCCCLFQLAFRCGALQMLVIICFNIFFCAKKLTNKRKSKKLRQNCAKIGLFYFAPKPWSRNVSHLFI